MNIAVHESKGIFHLYNEKISYLIGILPDGQAGNLYYGKRIHDREEYDYLLEPARRSHSVYMSDESGNELESRGFSAENLRMEYGVFGNGDFREPAVMVRHEDGSRVSCFRYRSYKIMKGKPELEGLPSTYTEDDGEAMTLQLFLEDAVAGLELVLNYTIFAAEGIIARSAFFYNKGTETLVLERAMSMCLDLPDPEYEWIQLSGSWARERHPVTRPLAPGAVSIESLRGHSSHQQNPFIVLKRPTADEKQGEVMGFSLVYSGNFLARAEEDCYEAVRVMMGIHPDGFSWKLEAGESFQTPEAVMVWTDRGLGGMSRIYHDLYRTRLARGYWRDRPRPILCNNWEATYFDFNEEKLLQIAAKARDCGVELFVLDDGWFGARRSDHAGLGDWYANRDILPGGIKGLSEKVEALGMKFGLWFEPEMVNPDSDLYRAHPDWVLSVPGRPRSLSRRQCILDFSRPEVVDHIHDMMYRILKESKISYIKWDMNRSMSECWSAALPADRQGETAHRYILGVYDLYRRLTTEFPMVLFESCAGGGARFDPGMLAYAPQAWCSDDTDAMERVKIQYGTSYCYPISSIGSHVSAVPNHQTGRITPLATRAAAAFFGTYGYELDLNRLSEEEQEQVSAYSAFMKQYRDLIQFGDFYRLRSPFEHNESGWMTVSKDKKTALAAGFRELGRPNQGFRRLRLDGLDPDRTYRVTVPACFGGDDSKSVVRTGDELMQIGLITSDVLSGRIDMWDQMGQPADFNARIFVLEEMA